MIRQFLDLLNNQRLSVFASLTAGLLFLLALSEIVFLKLISFFLSYVKVGLNDDQAIAVNGLEEFGLNWHINNQELIFLLIAMTIWLTLVRFLAVILQSRFVASASVVLAEKMFINIFGSSFLVQNQIKTSTKLAAFEKIQFVLANVLNPFFNVIFGVVVSCAIMFFLFSLMGFKTFFVVFCIVSSLGILAITLRRNLKKRSVEISVRQSLRVSELYNVENNIKPILIRKKIRFWLDRFLINEIQLRALQVKNNILISTPKIFIESGVYLIVFCSFLFFSSTGKNNYDIAVVIPGFIACLRLIPSLYQVFTGWAQLMANAHLIEEVHAFTHSQELIKISSAGCEESVEDHWGIDSINLVDVCFTYVGKSTPALQHITRSFQCGKVYAITGASGSGKTTLVNLVTGLFEPTAGEVQIQPNENNVWCDNRRRAFGYVAQDFSLFEGTLLDNVIGDEKVVDLEHLNRCLEIVCLENVVAQLPDGIKSVVGRGGAGLSGGQVQRLCIARALYAKPSVIIFDEATSGLDMELEARVLTNLKIFLCEGIGIFVTHRAAVFAIADEILEVKNGQIIEVDS